MRYTAAVVLLATVGCSSPTTPTPIAPVVNNVPAVTVTPPAVAAPPVVTAPTPDPLLSDPRFSLSFYRQLALDGYEHPNFLKPLLRFKQAPRIYLSTIDDTNRAIDPVTLDQTAAALINTAGAMTGAFGLAGLEQGTGTRANQPGWITVAWSTDPTNLCGSSPFGVDGGTITLYTRTNCSCGGYRMAPRVVKHELGHALGFYHTDSRADLMWGGSWPVSQCDMTVTEREKFHMRVAYSQPIGSLDPK